MDINLAKTFLAITDLGNFAKASDQLCVTQSTISTRIKQLEDLLGQSLFIRSKAGASMTPAGSQFKPFAEKLVQTWEQARQEIALPSSFGARLSVGVQFTLWERLMVKWLPWIRNAVPDYAILADVGSSEWLMKQLIDGLMDIVITYTPQNRSGLVVEKLMEERLVLISKSPKKFGPDQSNYIFVDWGPEYRMEHASEFPGRDMVPVSTNYGPMALQYILEEGGSAYLPMRLVRNYIDSGELMHIESAPIFGRPVFSVFIDNEDSTRFDTALQGLRYVASLEDE
jgi:LysR family transcriptional regulator, flagellar master operon regulator